ncbi:CheR family methyltransferase [Pseudochryseolinea flava]|uniref:CheR family methyltransferase n=1 Tax=Pseudochryseolinea flava TaxID=2059302 RepID=UPI0010577C73|nr:CheR family methyltransferase [Pseudochryseolinea flava]
MKKIIRQPNNRKVTTSTVDSKSPPPKPFPIVGFGASAGGLEAFSTVLSNLSANIDMAYVLVMHLSPNHKSALAEILQLKTEMKVHTVRNGMEVKMNNVYVIPPNASMSIVDGHLKLAPRVVTANGNFAIDYFLTALASVYKSNSVGVILSGTATDGTLGLKAIKAAGGITFTQDHSAQFHSMPKNAREAGYADFCLPPEAIAKELGTWAKTSNGIVAREGAEQDNDVEIDTDREALKRILTIVKSRRGVDFFLHYKQPSIYRRVLRRVALNKLSSLDDYYALLRKSHREVDELFNDFLINVTSFFRDVDFYKALTSVAIPRLIKGQKATETLRIWIAGCATGEEAYSIAITLAEYMEKKKLTIPYQVFASDLDAGAIEKARVGTYSISAMQKISSERLKKFFRKIDGHYQIEKSIREVCIFSQQNLLSDPPFSRMDLISCQNVLIYLKNEPQEKILRTFHYALKPNGFLFLGKSESIGIASELFDSLDKKIRMYGRKQAPSEVVRLPADSTEKVILKSPRLLSQPPYDLEREIGKVILSNYVMPCLVLNENLHIVQFFGITSHYLLPVVGKASFNILKMIREDLLFDLRMLIQQAKKTGRTVSKEGIVIHNNKRPQELVLEVAPRKMQHESFYLVIFREIPESKTKKVALKSKPKTSVVREQTIVGLEEELRRSRELIKSTNEEYETTYEELQANNEQILSSNEELQSINEEMETSKEELQSANEELTTINEELQKRNLELKQSQNYANAIVDTVNSPFLVLTANLQVRTANKSFYETFKLNAENTIGCFIYELDHHSWDIQSLREHLNDLLGKKTHYKEFRLAHFFSKLGDMAFLVNAYRLTEDKSKETLILLAFNNIGELLLSNYKLKSANEQLEQFIFISGHDLQEPLRKIQTFSNYLTEYENTDDYIKEYVGKIGDTASKMSNLLRDLLSYSSLLQNHKTHPRQTDLNTVLKDVLIQYDTMIQECEAVINVGTLPTILADASQMEMLFGNLISNALKFNVGKPVVTVTSEPITPEQIETHALNKEKVYVCIKVSDNGIGFNQKYIAKIFSIFQRLHDKKGIEGTGMGLPIAKKVVEDHGGRIYAEGKENKGATFYVFLPMT